MFYLGITRTSCTKFNIYELIESNSKKEEQQTNVPKQNEASFLIKQALRMASVETKNILLLLCSLKLTCHGILYYL